GFEIISDVTYRWYANQTDPADNAILWQETNDWPAPSDLWVEILYKGKPVKPRFNVRIDAYPVLTAGSIEADDTVCYSTVPEKLVSVSPAGGGNGAITYQWQYSEDSGENWHDISGETSEDYIPAAALTQTAWYRRQAGNDCGTVHTDSVKITVYPQSLGNYPDLRIRVCPDAGASVNLSKYIDSFAVTSILWESVSPPVPIIDTESGTVSANSFSSYASVYTLAYTVSNPCAVDIRRRVYLETLKPDRMRPLRDTVRICYEHAEAVQINQLFGIDARGTWKYYSVTDNDVDSYVTESTTPVYGGAVVMNGKDIYQDPSIAFYGVDTKKVEFIYKTHNDSCLHGKEYKMVIILTPDIIK
ncbi:MAG: hypothetical protein LBQ01_05650, partial [Prevotellaceae bacterium]|nr:hypothetical protein [Prevotellaceae bacterium]